MNPAKFAQMMKYLTRVKKQKPDLPDVFPASKAPIPPKTQNVEEIEAINAFIRRERQQKAGGGMLVQPGFGGTRQGYATPKDKLIDRELLSQLIENANNSDKFFTKEDIMEMYAKKKKTVGTTKRKTSYGDIKTYPKIKTKTFDSAGTLLPAEKKVERVLKEVLSMDGPVPDVKVYGTKRDKQISNYKKYIIRKVGVAEHKLGKILKTLPDYKNNLESFTYLKNSGLMRTDLVNMSLSDQLKWASEAKEGKPRFKNIGYLVADPNYVTMDFALRNWNLNKGKGDIKFYDINGDIIKWKNGLELPVTKVSFGYKGNRFGIGTKDKALNLRLVGKNYFPEVYQNLDYINQLKATRVDNPYKPGTKTSFMELMKRVYITDKGYKPGAPLFSIFHGPGGVGKEPFKNLSFGMQDLNQALYKIEKTVPLKGLRKKLIKQAVTGLEGLGGEDLIKSIINQQSVIAQEAAKGKPPIGSLRDRIMLDVATKDKTLGPKERDFLEKTLAGLSKNPKCIIKFGKKKVAAEGGRIGYATGPASLTECAKDGARVFNDGKLNTADQIKDGAKLLRGGRLVLSALSKYGIVPELAYVGLEAAGRTVLGEKPTNALLKSIDTLTFGATDFTSEIEAEKFGEYAKDKLAVDAFRGSQAKVRSILNNLERLEQINLEGGDVDVTQELQTLRAQLKSASDELRTNTVNPDLVQFIDKKQEEISDTQLAKSTFAKQSLRNQLEGFPGIKDYMDTEATRVFPFQQTQKQLNEKIIPSLSDAEDFLQLSTQDLIKRAQILRLQGQDVSAQELIDYQNSLKNATLSELAESGQFSPTSIYGASETFSTPLPSGALDKKPNIIPEMEREIVGQTNVVNPFDIDISDIGSGLRGFAAAGGGIAKEAGDRSGPPPEKGPMSQGLQGLMKRVRNL